MVRFNPSIGCRVKWCSVDIIQTDNWYQAYEKSKANPTIAATADETAAEEIKTDVAFLPAPLVTADEFMVGAFADFDDFGAFVDFGVLVGLGDMDGKQEGATLNDGK
eukprot:scaffold142_cov208-Chaetoceros_neogracile.AAC.3